MAKARGESSLRIIAGRWKGRRLRFLADGVRPTGDRVRETLFNWLAPQISGIRCLDMFAGTGALGIEALSRGAAGAVFVERNPAVASRLADNIAGLDCDSAQVVTADAASIDYRGLGPFDVVFMDPPFATGAGELANLCTLLETADCLNAGALIYIECAKQTGLPELPANWNYVRESGAGQVSFGLALRRPAVTEE
jgi:16S rRNA (guanine966-N2)-methyltransferase